MDDAQSISQLQQSEEEQKMKAGSSGDGIENGAVLM